MATTRPIYLASLTPVQSTDVIHLPLLSVAYHQPDVAIADYDIIIATSKQTIHALQRFDSSWNQTPLFCVGAATRKRAELYGATVLETANGYGDEIETLVKTYDTGLRWLYARPKVVASDFAKRLSQDGINISEVIIYETFCEKVRCTIEPNAIIIFTSPAVVRCFDRQFELLASQYAIAIGHTTAEALRTFASPIKIAPTPSIQSCIAMAKETSL